MPVKSRVDGPIVRVDFTEGQDVAAGAALFQIDPRPYQAALAQAQAVTAKDGIAAVTKGLAPGERVVVNGQYRLTDGARISPVPDPSER